MAATTSLTPQHLLHTSFIFLKPHRTLFFTPFLKPFPNHHHHRILAIATPDRVARFENHNNQDTETDLISSFNERILKDHFTKRNSGRYNNPEPHSQKKATVTEEEVDKYINLVKQQQQRGLRELKRGRLGGNEGSDGVVSYKVDPFSLEEGDYVVHKKVGIGRFMSIRPSIPEGSTVPIDYVYIQYADGVAKLPVKQASKFLYRYNLYVFVSPFNVGIHML